MNRTLRPFLILALLACAGVLAMHALSGHGSPATAESAATTDAIALAVPVHVAHGHPGGDPCGTCAHDVAAGMCAFIVLAVIASIGQSTSERRSRMPVTGRPTLRSWTPDPPVPRFLLVTAL